MRDHSENSESTPRIASVPGAAMTTLAGVLVAVIVVAVNAGAFVSTRLASAGLIWPVYTGLVVLGVIAVAATGRWRSAPVLLLLAFWIIGGLSMRYAWSITPDQKTAYREVLNLGFSALLSSAALLLSRRAGLQWWRIGWVVSLVFVSGIAAWEMMTAQHLWVHPWPFQPWVPVATYANPNNFGIVVLGMLVAALAWRAHTRSRAGRIALAVVAAASAILALVSQSRSAALGLVIIAALEVSRRLSAHPGAVRGFVSTHRRPVGIVTLVGALLVFASFTVPALAARNPVYAMLYAALQPETAKADLFRLDVSLLGLRYWWHSPLLLGTGAGSFESIMWNDPDSGIDIRANMHNAFIEMLSQYGIVVASVFAATLISLVVVWWRSRLSASLRPRVSIVRTELAGHLVVFIALGLTASSALPLPVWWLLLANACACTAALIDRRAVRSRRRNSPAAASEVTAGATAR